MAQAKTKKRVSAPKDTSGVAFAEPSARRGRIEWTPDLIRAAEIQADGGDYRLLGELCEWVMRDDKVQSALSNVVGAVLGAAVSFEASGDKRRSKTAIRALEAGEDYWKAFPKDESTQVLCWALVFGVVLAKINWIEDPETGRVPGRIEFRNPGNLRRDDKKRRWMLRVGDDGKEIEITPGDGTWMLITPFGARRPHRLGWLCGLARWVLLKDFAVKDLGVAGEGAAGTYVAATQVDSTGRAIGNAADKRKELANDLQDLGRGTSISLPPGWSLELLSLPANTVQIFERQIALSNEGITICIEGSNLTGEQGGSYAKALTLDGVNVKRVTMVADTWSIATHDQHLVWWAEFNFGDRRIAPWVKCEVEPPEDLKTKGESMAAFGAGIAALEAVSDRIDVDTLLEEAGYPLLTDAELAKKREEAKKNAPPAPPPPPPPAKGKDDKAAEGDDEEDGAKKGDDEEADARAHGLSAAPRFGAALEAMLGGKKAPGFVRGQAYADDLADEGRDLATVALKPDVKTVLRAIEEADSYEDLRDRVLTAFRAMKAAKAADVVEKAAVQGDLAGRLSVLEDT